jgi:hypothetical protein
MIEPRLQRENTISALVQLGADLLPLFAELLNRGVALGNLTPRQFAPGDMAYQGDTEDQQGLDQEDVNTASARQQAPRGP